MAAVRERVQAGVPQPARRRPGLRLARAAAELTRIVDIQLERLASRLADRRLDARRSPTRPRVAGRQGLRPDLRGPSAAPAGADRDRRPAGPGAAVRHDSRWRRGRRRCCPRRWLAHTRLGGGTCRLTFEAGYPWPDRQFGQVRCTDGHNPPSEADVALADLRVCEASAFSSAGLCPSVHASRRYSPRSAALRSTQNSLPSGSASTTHPAPSGLRWSATQRAPRPSNQSTS